MWWRKKDKNSRYQAHRHDYEVIGIPLGGVTDTRPDESCRLPDDLAEALLYVTTYSNAKRLARRANKIDRTS